MLSAIPPAADVVAILTLVFGLYFPRHRRSDMVVAYLVVNVGVLAVAQVLDNGAATTGLGLGLFGLLSIIRLRSTDIDHQEVAYYFAALTLGLLGGLTTSPDWLIPVLMVAILTAVFVGDHPRLIGRYRTQLVTLDVAYTDEALLTARLESVLGARVRRVTVRKIDLVDDTTSVEVRFELPAASGSPRPVGHGTTDTTSLDRIR